MTTITPTTVTISYTATLLSPLHHGAGTSGNTSLLRTQEVMLPDGGQARVPFLSAASIRHALRDRIAWHLADTLGLAPGSLSKTAIDLLWTGGAVTSTGAETDLAMARRVEEFLPSLGLFGYAAHSDITTGTLRATDLILVCAENNFRLPEGLRDGLRAAAYRAEEFGTRHDVASSPVARLVETADDLLGSTVKTTQMIFDMQVIKTGARMHGELSLTPAATAAHRMVLGAAVEVWAPGGNTSLGAKTATGYGRAALDGLGDRADDLAAWTSHIETHADAIIALVRDLSA